MTFEVNGKQYMVIQSGLNRNGLAINSMTPELLERQPDDAVRFWSVRAILAGAKPAAGRACSGPRCWWWRLSPAFPDILSRNSPAKNLLLGLTSAIKERRPMAQGCASCAPLASLSTVPFLQERRPSRTLNRNSATPYHAWFASTLGV